VAEAAERVLGDLANGHAVMGEALRLAPDPRVDPVLRETAVDLAVILKNCEAAVVELLAEVRSAPIGAARDDATYSLRQVTSDAECLAGMAQKIHAGIAQDVGATS
jgi:hypothetical protein